MPTCSRVLEAAKRSACGRSVDRERDDCWSGGRDVLLGDACHPMRPYMAAGGAMAVEDAAILSRCLAKFGDNDPAEAFRCYEATRIPRVAEVQRISIENSWMRGPTDTDWFYCYDACTAPLRCMRRSAHGSRSCPSSKMITTTFDPKPDPMIARDLVGYGETRPIPAWPGGALIAVNFNLNVEGGGEGDAANGDANIRGHAQRHRRAGLTRRARAAGRVGVRIRQPPRRLAAARRLRRVLGQDQHARRRARAGAKPGPGQRPSSRAATKSSATAIAGSTTSRCPKTVEREHIKRAVEILTKLTGKRPIGWMTGRPGPNTRRLLVEEGGFLYDRDSLADELPYWLAVGGRPHLVIPYSYETNDNRFNENSAASRPRERFLHLHARRLRCALPRGQRGSPKLLSIGLHDRLIGRPGRCRGPDQAARIHAQRRKSLVRHRRRHRTALAAAFPGGRLIARHCERSEAIQSRESLRTNMRLRDDLAP